MAVDLSKLSVAVLNPGEQADPELAFTLTALEKSGAVLRTLSGVDLERAPPSELARLDSLLLPASRSGAERTMLSQHALVFIRDFHYRGKPIAAAGWGSLLLVAAGLVHGQTLAAPPELAEPLRRAGGKWVDQPVCLFGNWLTSRGHQEAKAFTDELTHFFGRSTPDVIQVSLSA